MLPSTLNGPFRKALELTTIPFGWDSADEQLLIDASHHRNPPAFEYGAQSDSVDAATTAKIVSWCRKAHQPPMAESSVPGTNTADRAALAALGGFAAAIAKPEGLVRWPKDVRDWMKNAPPAPRDLVAELVSRIQSGDDVFARIYERIVSGPRRRHLGTFFTSPMVLDYMYGALAATSLAPPANVIDPGAGVGAFSTTSMTRWPDATVYAIDVNVVTLGLLAAHIGEASKLELINEDFLAWLTRAYSILSGPNIIIGNPPYTRHQLLPGDTKLHAQSACGALAPGARAGLSTYFLAASLNVLRPSDSLCLLLPANWLEADYARRIRHYLWSLERRPIELHIFPNDCQVFPGAQVGAMVLIIGAEQESRQALRFCSVIGGLEEGFELDVATSRIRAGDLPPTFTSRSLQPVKHAKRRAKTIPLGQLLTVRRGVATGANHFFLRNDAEIEDIPEELLLPAIARLRDISGHTLDKSTHGRLGLTGSRRWMLNLTEGDDRHAVVRTLLTTGEGLGIPDRHLCRARKVWYVLEKIQVPDLLLGPMSKHEFRIIDNLVGATPTNTLYGLRLKSRKSYRRNATKIAEWLRSPAGQICLIEAARSHGDGLMKLEPGVLSTLRVPAGILEGC